MSKVTPNFSEYRTVGEAAEFLGVTPATLRNWDRAGKLKPRRHPQNGYRIYLHEELEALLRTSGLSAADRGELAPRIDWSQFGESEHFIQLYETDDFLCDAVGGFVGAALGAGHCGILIATAEHRCGIEKRLTEYGISPEAAVEERRFVALNAAETLSRIMVNGSPSPRRFHEVIGGIIQEMSRSGRRVHAFGEMVALLWADNNREAALRLEELWCELGRACKFALCCGYPLAAFSGCDDGASFDGVCRSHSRVLPSDSYSTVNDPFDRLRTISRLQQQAMSLEAEIAHRHEAEKVLRHRERELADFFENATEGLQKVAPDGRILWANKAVLSMLGYEPEEFIGRRFAEFHVDQDAVAEMMRRLSSGRNLINQESQLRCSDGTIRDVLISSNACFEDGQFVYSRCFTRDVTEIRRADRDRALLAAIVESSQDAIVTKTLDGIIRSWNAGATRLFGYTESEAVNQPITLIIPPEKFAEESQILERLRRGEQVDHFETVRVAKGGRRIDVSLTVSPLRDQNGMLIGASKVARDIGERRRAHAALRASEDRYRRLAELLPVAVYTCESESGTITYFNNKAAELWGRAPQLGDIDATFCGSQELYLPDGTFLPHDQCPMAVALREGRAFRNQEVVIRRPDGSRIVALVNIDPILSPDGEVVGAVNVFHDVSALKLAEESLREQKENLQTLLETLPVAVFIAADRECRRISGNHAALQLLRLPAGANLSKTADPEEQPVNFRVLKRGQEIAPQNLPIQRAARGETVLAEEVDHEFSDGAMVNTIVSAKPLYALDGQPRGAVACMLDVSDLKQAEIALREAAERKDAFLAVLAHELRNPLAPIRNGLELLRVAGSDTSIALETRDIMERQMEHLTRLVDDLLDISRITRDRLELRTRRVEFAEIVRSALETSRPLIDQAHHTFTLSLPSEPVFLEADLTRMSQVFSNLLNNSAKYTEPGGRVSLLAQVHGSELVVVVEDDGIGIPREDLAYVFDMFRQVDRSLHRSRGGLGIGLTLVRRLVELHGGTVHAHSEGEGRGSAFTVRLPIVMSAGPQNAGMLPGQLSLSGRRILVVDDNRDSVSSLTTLFRIKGNEVRGAHDGLQAVDVAAEFQPEIILMDVGMPRLDGYEATRRIRQMPGGHEIFIVALSGWGQPEDLQKAADAGCSAHLTKPVDFAVLDQLLTAKT